MQQQAAGHSALNALCEGYHVLRLINLIICRDWVADLHAAGFYGVWAPGGPTTEDSCLMKVLHGICHVHGNVCRVWKCPLADQGGFARYQTIRSHPQRVNGTESGRDR
jgi:hypothetical protein